MWCDVIITIIMWCDNNNNNVMWCDVMWCDNNNRSACYFSLKQYQKAFEDALLCVSKDPKFIKGYYRLSSAQTELQLFDDSIAILKAALSIEPGMDTRT